MPENQQGRLVVTVDLLIDGDRDGFIRLMIDNAAASLRDEPGCYQFDVCVDSSDDKRLFLYEVYADDAAFSAHLASPHYRAFDAQTAGIIVHKDVRRLWLRAG
ncbi:MAG TPA: putative quinol monooxygenase [Devosia sp.]|nr:putative quinol monooxygenase [Devosia sp.]